jgi:hypothetical protein
MYALNEIRTRDPSNQAAADLSLRQRGHQLIDNPSVGLIVIFLLEVCACAIKEYCISKQN